jgi:hypothetical protein
MVDRKNLLMDDFFSGVNRLFFDRHKKLTKSGNNSAVECNLAKVEVAGSNPVSRSISFSAPF